MLQVLQLRTSYVQHMTLAVQECIQAVEGNYVGDAAYTGPAFKLLSAYRGVTSSNPDTAASSPLILMAEDGGDDEAVIHMKLHHASTNKAVAEPVLMLAVPRRTGTKGRPRNTPTVLTRTAFEALMGDILSRCTEMALAFIADVQLRFPAVPLLEALTIAYPHYWYSAHGDDVGDTLEESLHELKDTFCVGKTITVPATEDSAEEVVQCEGLLDADTLDLQSEQFRRLAGQCASRAMTTDKSDAEKVTLFWKLMTDNPVWRIAVSEFIKVGEIALTMVGGSVEDERAFSAMSFLKNTLRNRLDTHLEVCMRLKMQDHYTVSDFPYHAAYNWWLRAKDRRM